MLLLRAHHTAAVSACIYIHVIGCPQVFVALFISPKFGVARYRNTFSWWLSGSNWTGVFWFPCLDIGALNRLPVIRCPRLTIILSQNLHGVFWWFPPTDDCQKMVTISYTKAFISMSIGICVIVYFANSGSLEPQIWDDISVHIVRHAFAYYG